MKTITSITIAASVPTLAYFGFTLPNEGMSNVAHTMAWIIAALSLLSLLVISAESVEVKRAQKLTKTLSEKPANKVGQFFNRTSYLAASVVFVFYGSIATGIATLFVVFAALSISHQIKSAGE